MPLQQTRAPCEVRDHSVSPRGAFSVYKDAFLQARAAGLVHQHLGHKEWIPASRALHVYFAPGTALNAPRLRSHLILTPADAGAGVFISSSGRAQHSGVTKCAQIHSKRRRQHLNPKSDLKFALSLAPNPSRSSLSEADSSP